ncbi:hypothetical protein HBO10_23390 [Pseudomonas sp. WS 5503]|uniref:hypothetical protein n=1 Tax=Pseudomonas TaxID=286 RepID=UPI0002E8AA69|nr:MULTISPECIES: hypothetical protein [Pseudomonas]MBF6043083.1 hypothetical protein [Pseudomonas mucoides]MBJ2203777.1 hypothetical protein [Pseudomonas carnis]NMX82471.1 hypothetical protein [Pseudomonas sp. WS 5503]
MELCPKYRVYVAGNGLHLVNIIAHTGQHERDLTTARVPNQFKSLYIEATFQGS